MATITELYSGTATIGATEYSLTNDSTTIASRAQDGPIQIFLECNNLVNGDEYELTIYEKVLSGSTQRVVSRHYIQGALGEPNVLLPFISVKHGWDVTLTKINGTDRSISWSIRTM